MLAFDPFGPTNAPEIIYKKLGTETDCLLRTSNTEYCSDLFAAIDDIDAFWRTTFPKIVPAGQRLTYSSPSGYYYYEPNIPQSKIDCSDEATPGEFCTPAFYHHGEKVVVFNEPSLLSFHRDKGDLGALVVVAHEWGHHIQNLLGRFSTSTSFTKDSFDIQHELQADCYAGQWVAHTEDQGYLEDGDIEEAMRTAFLGGDDEVADWQDTDVHGLPQQRVLAFRSGYTFTESATCRAWESYSGQDVWEFTDHDLAVYPTVTDEEYNSDVERLELYTPDGGVYVKARPKLASGSASANFAAISALALGDAVRWLDTVTVSERPGPGTLNQAAVSRSSQMARRYQQTEDGETFHGIFYLHVRPDGGGISVDVFEKGPASGAKWGALERNLRTIVMGLSLN
ncbi:MAG TPA: neutral zinc metallopeptidase [Dehalococcoidia bacterium]|nr:neutral zinc metallopeptidase [Dehalococcoidia bacterium]